MLHVSDPWVSFLVSSDFLLLVLKDIVSQRPTLQVILMSATLDAGLFSKYFSYCPVITIPGNQSTAHQSPSVAVHPSK